MEEDDERVKKGEWRRQMALAERLLVGVRVRRSLRIRL